jgi:hypothetical protein
MRTPGLSVRRRTRVVFSLAASLALPLVAGCLDRPVCPVEPRLTATVYERLAASQIDKVDLLLAVDNSPSMHDKQTLLALAVPDLVSGLVNPPCLDKNGAPVLPGPKSPLEACPEGSARPFDPILDIHIGVITSSLGSHGADACPSNGPWPNDDRGHLVARKDSLGKVPVPTYQNLGFLAWDPTQKLAPPGEADLTQDSGADPGDSALVPLLTDMITGTGQVGCSYESQLESWYRFLVDPSPYDTLSLDADGRVKLSGVDQTLLAQRKAFLRPDSIVSIVLLTDENDCSVREGGDYYLALQSDFQMPAPRAECATDPNDACCFSCGQTGPKDNGNPVCPEDPTCKDETGKVRVVSGDPLTVRCWDQKRRFGIDFLYPLDRYVQALRSETIVDRNGQTVPNPLFSALDPAGGASAIRDPSMVVFTAIAGVPWQDIARDPKDLTRGYKTYEELSEKDASGKTRWDVIVGDPGKNVPPGDPLMIESLTPRGGVNPITGDPLVTDKTPLKNPINGHDYLEKPLPDWLQYACIFPLLEPVPCDIPGQCNDYPNSPIYDPPYEDAPSEQKRAGALPGLRFLSLLKSLGSQGVTASVCPAQTSNKDALDFGYRPAIASTLSRVQASLVRRCLPRVLDTGSDGQVSCTVVEARHKEPGGACCDPDEARLEPSGAAQQAIEGDAAVKQAGYDCFCEIPQLTGTQPGEPLWTCQNDTAKEPILEDGQTLDGYCYVDATAGIGNSELVATCPETEKRAIRFLGKANPRPGATTFITCGSTEQGSHTTCE